MLPPFRRLFDGPPLWPRLRRRWEWIRPVPLPNYESGTPKIGGSGPLDPFLPPNAATLGRAATSQEAVTCVAALLAMLTQNEEIEEVHAFYCWAEEKFGQHWHYADILTVLWAAATLIRPTSYLEIGVRTGRSTAVVATTSPACAIYGFDLWLPDYGSAPNPGPDFVRQELRAVGHTGSVTLISGDSRKTVPAFLRQHPDLYFDLITIDGDHSVLGAATDLANTLPRLKVGGGVAFDDICMMPHLMRVWKNVVKRDSRYVSWEFTDSGFGVAAAVRMSDEPVLVSLAAAQ